MFTVAYKLINLYYNLSFNQLFKPGVSFITSAWLQLTSVCLFVCLFITVIINCDLKSYHRPAAAFVFFIQALLNQCCTLSIKESPSF